MTPEVNELYDRLQNWASQVALSSGATTSCDLPTDDDELQGLLHELAQLDEEIVATLWVREILQGTKQ